jgi:methanogenic corrinoid protein MtbC1
MSAERADKTIGEPEYQLYLKALIDGDHRACWRVYSSFVDADVDLRVLYRDVVHRSLHEVGDLWQCGAVSVATEHMATAITESVLTLSYPRLLRRARCGRVAVVTSMANEYHQIGARMVADMFELHGWRAYFLGANTPMPDLMDMIGARRPQVLALSLTVQHGMDVLLGAVRSVRGAFPSLPILVGGQAFAGAGREAVVRIPGVRCLESLAELEAWIDAAGSTEG